MSLSPDAAARACVTLHSLLTQGRGARLGEAAVVSRRVHVLDPAHPEEVRVVVNADAGQVFYGRRVDERIVHVDVFHAVGEVDQRQIAGALRQAMARCQGCPGRCGLCESDLDWVDLQTALGGGRASGSLAYGQTTTLRQSHLNHVHLAVGWEQGGGLAGLPCLVDAVERSLQVQGLAIRRVERLVHEAGNGPKQDISDYASRMDTYLREPADSLQQDAERAQGMAETVGYMSSLLNLAEDFGSLDEVADALEAMASGEVSNWFERLARVEDKYTNMEKLRSAGLVSPAGPNTGLTEVGRRILDYLREHRQELNMEFKRLLRKLPWQGASKLTGPRVNLVRAETGRRLRVQPLVDGEWPGELAVPETVVAAMTRHRRSGAASLALERDDLRVVRRTRYRPVDICLVLDASASMAGRRLRAAKSLAEHLLMSTRDRLSVVVFQEKDVRVQVPFTQDIQTARAGLARVRPLGLTPLAEGVIGGLNYLKGSRARNPLLLLITDGIPTVPAWSLNPLEDARQASRQVAAAGVPFGCIGLEPNKEFLQGMVREGNGTLYSVDELEKEAMARIAQLERGKLVASATRP
ncbi:MAG: VWA domain-containing protein [Bacillota bacterium]